jgi:uncharacterized protein (DUF305 family)
MNNGTPEKMELNDALALAFEAGSLSIIDMFSETAEEFGVEFAYGVLKDFRGEVIQSMDKLRQGSGKHLSDLSQQIIKKQAG